MRNIKSRGKAVDGSGWVYGYPVPCPDVKSRWVFVGNMFLDASKENIETSMFVEVVEETIGNYCGFMDYFNTPAYDGDIIMEEDKYVGIIRFGEHAPHVSDLDKTGAGYYVEWLGPMKGVLRSDVGYWLARRNLVIRGNIFDNPELLEVKE